MTDRGTDVSPGGAVIDRRPASRLPSRRAIFGTTLAALGLCAAVGYVVGADVTERRHDLGGWHTGIAHVGSRVASIDGGDWVYGASDSVEAWIDRRGSWHESGWPTCLRVPPGSSGPVGDVPVRFAAHEVTVDGQPGGRSWQSTAARTLPKPADSGDRQRARGVLTLAPTMSVSAAVSSKQGERNRR